MVGGQRRYLFWCLYVAMLVVAGYGRMIERILRESGGFWRSHAPEGAPEEAGGQPFAVRRSRVKWLLSPSACTTKIFGHWEG